MTDQTDLHDVLNTTTIELRKGEPVEHKDGATHVYMMPHESEWDGEKVDVHFMVVGITPEAAQYKDALCHILDAYPQPDRLAGGPSYIETGAVWGSQSAALRVYALGEALGLWQVITPERLGFEGHEADEMAGGGMVLITGYHRGSDAD